MVVVASKATGNFLTAGTWGLVDSTSFQNSETANQGLTTTYSGSRSSAFTPGAITIDGVGVKLSTRVGTTGTISVELSVATVPVTGTEVTLNVADLPAAAAANLDGGWIFFKFAAPVLLIAATAYTIEAKTSSATQVNLFRDGTAGNISRYLRTTTNQAPAAGDDMIVVGEYTGAGTSNTLTITMNETATTDYGSNTASLVQPALAVGSKGILRYGVAGSTNYYLKLSGNAVVYLDGDLDIGTTGASIPSTSTAVLEFDPAADGDMGLTVRNGTCTMQGNPITVSAMLAADASAAATSLTTNVSTGWKSGDVIGLASTTRTASETESKALTADAVTTTLTITALTNAHSGTSPIAGEMINQTRNVKVRSATSTIMAYICMGITTSAAPVVDWDYVEIYYVGENATFKRGVEITIAGSTVNLNGISFHDTEDGGIYCNGGAPVIAAVGYNMNTANVLTASVTLNAGTPTLSGIFMLLATNVGNAAGVLVSAAGAILSSITVVGCTTVNGATAGFGFNFNAAMTGSVSNCIAHSNATRGFLSYGGTSHKMAYTSCTAWRNNSVGFGSGGSGFQIEEIIYVSCTSFGNNSQGFSCSSGLSELRSCSAYGGTTLVQAGGLLGPTPGGSVNSPIAMAFDCTFGSPSVHSTQDISAGEGTMYLFNCDLQTTTEVTPGTDGPQGIVRSQKNDLSATTFKTTYRYGTIVNDVTTRHTASGYSWKMTPTSSSRKLVFPGPTRFDTMKTPVAASALVTITVYVQKDGSYNGNQPRLVLVGGIVGGVGSAGTDVVGTMAGGSGAWEQLSVSATPNESSEVEWYVDCDGTAGNVYVDDAAVVQTGNYIDTGLLDLPTRGLCALHVAPIPSGSGVRRVNLNGGF